MDVNWGRVSSLISPLVNIRLTSPNLSESLDLSRAAIMPDQIFI